MKKELRIRVFKKYNAHCAYCGNEIEYKNFQVDHKIPQIFKHLYDSSVMRKIYNIKEQDINDFENLMPTCRRCNHYKRSYLLEEYRKLLLTLHNRIKKQYISKVAIDYNIIKINNWDGIFYFERIKNEKININSKYRKRRI